MSTYLRTLSWYLKLTVGIGYESGEVAGFSLASGGNGYRYTQAGIGRFCLHFLGFTPF